MAESLKDLSQLEAKLNPAEFDIFKEIPFLKFEILGNSIYAYLLTIVSFGILWAAFHFARFLFLQHLARPKVASGDSHRAFEDFASFAVTMVYDIRPWFLPLITFFLAVQRLDLSPSFAKGLRYVVMTAVTFQAIQLISKAITYLITRLRLTQGDSDNLAVRNSTENLATLVKIIVWVAGVLFLLDNFGVNISTFIAGLGIGGIAIALAAQALLGDAFSSFAIAMDKPFEVGDYIIVDDLQGTVEHIGLKTTRIRSLGGELLVFGNSDLTKSRVRNYKRMNQRRINFQIGVEYGTSLESLKLIPTMIKEAIETTPGTVFDRAHFFKFDAYALTYDIVFYVTSPEYGKYMDTQQEINFKLHQALSSQAIAMAFPTQTVIYRNQDQTT